VTSSFHRRLRLLLVSAAALVVWIVAPGTGLDRAAFTTVARSLVNPPLFVSGNGTRADPWKLRAFSPDSKSDRRNAPVIVALEDDPEGFFQSSPPAPIDLAVIFTNFHRLGAKKAAAAAVLAWETPDPIGLAALEKSLARFDSLVMAAPLSRGAVASAMPRAFRRASIPLSAVRGDTSSLPVVNRVPIPGVILGGQNALAGFSVLEAEAADRFPRCWRAGRTAWFSAFRCSPCSSGSISRPTAWKCGSANTSNSARPGRPFRSTITAASPCR